MKDVIVFLGGWLLLAIIIALMLSRLICKAKKRDRKYFDGEK